MPAFENCLLPLALKTQNDSFIFVNKLKQEMFADLQYVQSLEKEIDELESDKTNFLKIYDLLLRECVSKDVMCLYLHSLADIDEQTKLKSLYLDKIEEYERLKLELSKHTENVEQMKNDTVCKQKGSTEIIAISELKKLIDKIKGKGVDTNFEKLSILGKPPLQPIRGQLMAK
ncbi:hypothetical protein Tco_1467960 [Tanacetum coccineum]